MYEYNALITRVIDGDTVVADVDLGFKVYISATLRLFGINTPETRGVTKQSGLTAKQAAIDWLNNGDYSSHGLEDPTVGRWPVLIRTYRDQQGKFGRYLATIYRKTADPIPLNQHLVVNGFAEYYVP